MFWGRPLGAATPASHKGSNIFACRSGADFPIADAVAFFSFFFVFFPLPRSAICAASCVRSCVALYCEALPWLFSPICLAPCSFLTSNGDMSSALGSILNISELPIHGSAQRCCRKGREERGWARVGWRCSKERLSSWPSCVSLVFVIARVQVAGRPS